MSLQPQGSNNIRNKFNLLSLKDCAFFPEGICIHLISKCHRKRYTYPLINLPTPLIFLNLKTCNNRNICLFNNRYDSFNRNTWKFGYNTLLTDLIPSANLYYVRIHSILNIFYNRNRSVNYLGAYITIFVRLRFH